MRGDLLKKPVICTTDGQYFESVAEAAAYYGLSHSAISLAAHKKRKTAGKREFMFLLDFHNTSSLWLRDKAIRWGRKKVQANARRRMKQEVLDYSFS